MNSVKEEHPVLCRKHIRNLQFCHCETEATRLVRYKLWPSTTKSPRLAFDMELLKWLNGLLLEGNVSVKSFCESLEARSSKHHRVYLKSQVRDVYKVLMTEKFEEFRHFIYSTENLSNIDTSLDGTHCPACFSTSPKIYSFDADFQLVRKASSGRNWGEPKHQQHFFLDQKDVDLFMETYNADRKKTLVVKSVPLY